MESESKPLSSLFLCGDDCEENAFGGIASFDNMDLGVVPDNVTYENLQNHHTVDVNAGSGKSYFHRPPNDEDVSLSSASVETAGGRPPPITLLSMDDSNVFTSHDGSSCRVENELGSLLNNFAESSVDNSLPAEKISSVELTDVVKSTETIRNRIASTDGFVDLKGNCALASAASSDLNCTDRNSEDDSCRNVSDSSSTDKRQSRKEFTVSNDGAFFEDEQEVNGGSARMPSEDWTNNREKELNEDGEEIEEDEDEETEEEEDEEEEEEAEDRENTSYEENLSEMLDDGKAALVKEEKNDLTDNDAGCDAGPSISQDFEAPIIKSEPQDLPPDVDIEERPKKPKKKKKKRKLESDVEKEGKQRPKKKRRRKNKDRSESSKQKSEFGNARRSTFERKNIRKILDDNLDEETKAAQKEEMERKQRLLEIQEKLRQQALELRAQREKEMLNTSGMDKLKNSALKSLLEEKADSPSSGIGDLMRSHGTMVPRPQKAPDVVEISSSDEEEDNDIIMMSEEEDDKDEEEDLENSGSHVNDALNRPDAQGCVLVNVGHPSEEADIFLAPQLASIVKPHQIGGIRFLYDNVVESLERYKTSNGFGCILAHSMGLGKTIQVIAFIDIYLRHTGARSVLIIVPVNTLQNWINEFNMWLPTVEEENRASIDPEILWPRDFKLHVINDNMKMTAARAKVVADWHETGGVLLLGYEMYRLLIKTKGIAPKPKRSAKRASAEPLVIDIEEEEGNKELVKALHEALMRPGPDLVICDEGHRIKNSHASISQVLKNIRTKRRVVLTGYPLQNNLLEYWCMVDFVRPNYLGTKTEFCNMFERPIMNGQCVDSTPSDVKLMRFRAHVLHSLLEGFVQRRGHTVLQTALPAKEEYVIFIRMSPIQRQLYNEFMSSIKDSGLTSWSNSNNPIKAFSVCCKIWNHPDILHQIVEQRKDDNDLDIEDAKTAADVPSTPTAPGKAKGKGKQKQNNSSTPASAPQSGQTQTPGMTLMSSQAPGQTQVPGLIQMAGQNQIPGPEQVPGMMQVPDSSLLPGLIQASGQTQVPCLVQDPCPPTNGIFGMSEEAVPSVLPGAPSSLAPVAASETTTPGTSDAATAAGVAGPATPDDESTAAAAAATAAVIPAVFDKKESQVISYDWATNLMKDYLAGVIEHSGKMLILLDIIEESVAIGDKILVFSQSLFTLSLIEDYLAKRIVAGTEETWVRNRNYFRLDGSTSGIDREKLINQFNDDNNDKIHLFLLSTRAGCLGINLVGASRVIIFDASWNPCHDCQAVCRVYRYGQTKCCYVYRLVTDNTMEKNIYDRQINKQGISDRVVDELNPQNLLSRKQVDILMRYEDADLPTIEAKDYESSCSDPLLGKIVTRHYNWITKEPFTHESLLLDRKDQKLTKHEKRLAKQGYEMEKKMSSFGLGRPGSYSAFYQKNADGIPIIRYGAAGGRPVASVRPMMSTPVPMNRSSGGFQTRILGQNFGNAGMKPGVSVQQVQTTTDIIIPPTNTTSDSAPSKIPAGEKVLIIKTPKGVYIRTSHGKIFAVRTASKTTTTTSVPSSTTITSTTSQAVRKTAPSTTTRVTSTTVSFVSTITGSTATNTQSTVKSMTSSTGVATASMTNSEAVTSLAASTSASTAMSTPVPSAAVQKSAFEVKPPAGQQSADVPVKLAPQLNQPPGTMAQPPRVPILPAVVATAANTTKAGTASGSASKSVSSVGNSSCRAPGGSVVGGGAHVQHVNKSVTGVTPSIGSYGVPPAHTLATKNSGHGGSVPAPAEDRSYHEPMWDRAPGFDDLLSDSDDPNAAHVVHPGLDHPRQQSAQQPGAAADSFYHGFLGVARSSPSSIVPNSSETQPSGSRQSSSSKAFVPVDHRTPQSVPPRHPMPMAPPYLPPAMGPYGMPSPYPWMPSMPHMWMQPMGPMGRMGMDGFPDAFSSSDGADFSNEMNFDDLGSDDRSFSSLLLGSESDDILGRRGMKGLDGSRTSGSAYRHGTNMPYSSGMGGYPYHPYPYNMPQGGYYPPPHPSPSPSSQGPSTSMNRSYIPMHYPTPMPASHMGMHPGYMPPPGMMPAYDTSAASTSGRNISGKKHEFDLKDN